MKLINSKSCLDRSLECAAMEWNGKTCTLSERAFTHCQVINVGANTAFRSEWFMFRSVYQLRKRLASAWKIWGNQKNKMNSCQPPPAAPFFYCSCYENILPSPSEFYVSASLPACSKHRWFVDLLKNQIYKGAINILTKYFIFISLTI